jgi:predicted nucleotidyltransferase component of viral defense system
MWAEREAVEIFHLVFLRAFGVRVDKALFALKGGCNLRFFLRSIRYSEDMDVDVRTMSVGTLRSNVDRVLGTASVLKTLASQQIEVGDVSVPKQTDTTQRWKIALRVGPARTTVPTKIEFSRRELDAGAVLEPVNGEITRRYRLYSVLFVHYSAQAAFCQKVAALAGRTETQARDVFDLKQLLDAGAGHDPLPEDSARQLIRAVENAMTVGYDAFAGQVLAYLEPEHQTDYAERAVWEALQEEVVNALEALQA